MSKTLKQIEQVVDDYEKELRKLDLVVLLDSYKSKEVRYEFKRNNLNEFFLDWLYLNHIAKYNKETTFGYTKQTNPNTGLSEYTIAGARRSIGDLFRLALNYYSKNITLYDVMKVMYDLSRQPTTIKKDGLAAYGNVEMQICSTIHRRTFYSRYGSTSTTYKFNSSNGSYSQQSYLENEFQIFGEDYNKLFNTLEGKEFLKEKLDKKVSIKTPNEAFAKYKDAKELDELVAQKLKSLRKISAKLA